MPTVVASLLPSLVLCVYLTFVVLRFVRLDQHLLDIDTLVRSIASSQVRPATQKESCHFNSYSVLRKRTAQRHKRKSSQVAPVNQLRRATRGTARCSRKTSDPVDPVKEVDTQEPIMLDQHMLDVDMLVCSRQSSQGRFCHDMFSLSPSSSHLVLISPRGPRESPERVHRT